MLPVSHTTVSTEAFHNSNNYSAFDLKENGFNDRAPASTTNIFNNASAWLHAQVAPYVQEKRYLWSCYIGLGMALGAGAVCLNAGLAASLAVAANVDPWTTATLCAKIGMIPYVVLGGVAGFLEAKDRLQINYLSPPLRKI